jgi:hypothetical protein
VISYCPVCVLLNLNLAPTCKTDYLVFVVAFIDKLGMKNSIEIRSISMFFVISFFSNTTKGILILTNDGVKNDTYLFVNLVLVITSKAFLFELDHLSVLLRSPRAWDLGQIMG